MNQTLFFRIASAVIFSGVVVTAVANTPSKLPPPSASSSAASKNEVADFLKKFVPLSLPFDSESKSWTKQGQPLSKNEVAAFVCNKNYLNCQNFSADGLEFFAVASFKVSEKIVAILVKGLSDQNVFLGLLTINELGEVLGGRVIAGEFGDFEYGYQAKISANGTSLSMAHYVWVQPSETGPSPASADMPATDGGKVPTVTRAAELPALDGTEVLLRGTYRQQSLPLKKGEPLQLSGTAAIELKGRPSEAISIAWDGAPMLVQLGTEDRPTDEIERLRDKLVEVRGTLALRPLPVSPLNVAQATPEPRLQNPGIPSLFVEPQAAIQKEYVKSYDYQLKPDGEMFLVINP